MDNVKLFYTINFVDYLYMASKFKEHIVNALVPAGDEGRAKLR